MGPNWARYTEHCATSRPPCANTGPTMSKNPDAIIDGNAITALLVTNLQGLDAGTVTVDQANAIARLGNLCRRTSAALLGASDRWPQRTRAAVWDGRHE